MANVRTAQAIARGIDPSWPRPVKYLGGGVNGRVYETNDGRLMKFIYDYAPQEYEALRKLQGTYIVPRFKKGNAQIMNLNQTTSKTVRKVMFPKAANLSNDLTVFVMGRAGDSSAMTLYTYLQTHPEYNKANVQRRVEYLVEQMALRGISHGDLHANNIIVTVGPSGRITGMWAIDFGRSRKLAVGNTERQAMGRLNFGEMFTTHSIFPPYRPKNVPVRQGSRANVHMMETMYGKRLSPAWERRVANLRKNILETMKQYKSPGKTLRPKAKSLSPTKHKSPPRPRSAPARIATPQKGLKVTLSLKRKRAGASLR